MALTPEDVVNKRFNPTKFREGYDQDEVDDFLDEVVVELRRLNQDNEELRQRLMASESRINELQAGGAVAAPAAGAPAPSAAVAVPEPAYAPQPVSAAAAAGAAAAGAEPPLRCSSAMRESAATRRCLSSSLSWVSRRSSTTTSSRKSSTSSWS